MIESYRHHWQNGKAIDLPLGKVLCVGRNYAAHARELNNPVPGEPLLFLKPATALAPLDAPLTIPQGQGSVHHELEVALLVGTTLPSNCATPSDAIIGVGLALDLTLRDVQSELKAKGHPWEVAKGFDGACPCSAFIPAREIDLAQALSFSLQVNGEFRQQGNTMDMLFPINTLLQAMATHFTLLPGDIVLTGTPSGVSALHPGDMLQASLNGRLQVDTQVVG